MDVRFLGYLRLVSRDTKTNNTCLGIPYFNTYSCPHRTYLSDGEVESLPWIVCWCVCFGRGCSGKVGDPSHEREDGHHASPENSAGRRVQNPSSSLQASFRVELDSWRGEKGTPHSPMDLIANVVGNQRKHPASLKVEIPWLDAVIGITDLVSSLMKSLGL